MQDDDIQERIDALERALSPKKRNFAHEYVKDFNATEAALRAGYGKTRDAAAVTGSRLRRKPEVRELIDMLLRDAAACAGATPDGIITRLQQIAGRCMSAEPVQEWDSTAKQWVNSGEYRFDSRGALKALELMGRYLGMENQEQENALSGTINIEFGSGDGDDGG